jgi:hypothetical protein
MAYLKSMEEQPKLYEQSLEPCFVALDAIVASLKEGGVEETAQTWNKVLATINAAKDIAIEVSNQSGLAIPEMDRVIYPNEERIASQAAKDVEYFKLTAKVIRDYANAWNEQIGTLTAFTRCFLIDAWTNRAKSLCQGSTYLTLQKYYDRLQLMNKMTFHQEQQTIWPQVDVSSSVKLVDILAGMGQLFASINAVAEDIKAIKSKVCT